MRRKAELLMRDISLKFKAFNSSFKKLKAALISKNLK